MKTNHQMLKTYVRLGKSKGSDDSLKCRMCLTRFTDMIDIFPVESEHPSNISIVHFCTGLEMKENDGLPARMCAECYRNLMEFFAFKRMCLASDKRLRLSRDAAIKQAEISSVPQDSTESEIKTEPQDELSLAENSDMVLLETDGFHPDAPDEVFSQICQFEIEEEFDSKNWRLETTPVICVDVKDEVFNFDDEADEEPSDGEPPQLVNQLQVPDIQNHSKELSQSLSDLEELTSKPVEPSAAAPILDTQILEEETRAFIPPKSYDCPVCYKKFRYSCTLKRHEMIHIGPQHHCPHCQKPFTQKDSLKRHMQTHSERRFVCAECSKVLVSRAGLKCHIRTHHTDRSQTNNYFKYKCMVCTKSFAHSSGLSRHMGIHRGVKYNCNVCDKKFNDTTQLKRHKRIHSKVLVGSNSTVPRRTRNNETISKTDDGCTIDETVAARLPVAPQPLDFTVNKTVKKSDAEESDLNSDNSSKDVFTITRIRPEREGSGLESSQENRLLKIPCNRSLYGEDRPKYLVLQAL